MDHVPCLTHTLTHGALLRDPSSRQAPDKRVVDFALANHLTDHLLPSAPVLARLVGGLVGTTHKSVATTDDPAAHVDAAALARALAADRPTVAALHYCEAGRALYAAVSLPGNLRVLVSLRVPFTHLSEAASQATTGTLQHAIQAIGWWWGDQAEARAAIDAAEADAEGAGADGAGAAGATGEEESKGGAPTVGQRTSRALAVGTCSWRAVVAASPRTVACLYGTVVRTWPVRPLERSPEHGGAVVNLAATAGEHAVRCVREAMRALEAETRRTAGAGEGMPRPLSMVVADVPSVEPVCTKQPRAHVVIVAGGAALTVHARRDSGIPGVTTWSSLPTHSLSHGEQAAVHSAADDLGITCVEARGDHVLVGYADSRLAAVHPSTGQPNRVGRHVKVSELVRDWSCVLPRVPSECLTSRPTRPRPTSAAAQMSELADFVTLSVRAHVTCPCALAWLR